jgi:hypothetical protein
MSPAVQRSRPSAAISMWRNGCSPVSAANASRWARSVGQAGSAVGSGTYWLSWEVGEPASQVAGSAQTFLSKGSVWWLSEESGPVGPEQLIKVAAISQQVERQALQRLTRAHRLLRVRRPRPLDQRSTRMGRRRGLRTRLGGDTRQHRPSDQPRISTLSEDGTSRPSHENKS